MILVSVEFFVLENSVLAKRTVHFEVFRRQFQPFFMWLIKGWIVKLLNFLAYSVFVLKQMSQKSTDSSEFFISDCQMIFDKIVEELFLIRKA